MNNEASRKAFEAWAKAAPLNTELWWASSDTYKANTTNAAWEAWQASRRALEAEQAQAVETPIKQPLSTERAGLINTPEKVRKFFSSNFEALHYGRDDQAPDEDDNTRCLLTTSSQLLIGLPTCWKLMPPSSMRVTRRSN